MSNQHDDAASATGAKDQPFNIQIDRVHYKVEATSLTGVQLRALPANPIAADRDLFLVVPGGADQKVGDAETVELRNGARFFTAPGKINPG